MGRANLKIREEARRLFLSRELNTNAEIAGRLAVKPHTVGGWRKEEGWDDLRVKVDKRAAEKLIEQLSTEKVTLNVRHYKYWEYLLTQMVEGFKGMKFDVREWERIATILDKAQKGQRLARGLSTTGENEEQIRAEAAAENRALVDAFVDAVKNHVADPEAREKIRQAVLTKLPTEPEDVEQAAG
jgi:hypothetical protein